MGIKGLKLFMLQMCTDVVEEVNLSEIANKYRTETGREPVLLIDISSCIESFFYNQSQTSRITAGEVKKFRENFKYFVGNSKQLGIKLRVFTDGRRPPYKVKSWKDNKIKDWEIINKLYSGEEIGPAFLCRMTLFEVIHNDLLDDCEYSRAIWEADDDMFAFIKTQRTFAVLTCDTDFVIPSNVDYCLFPKDHPSMTHFNYNRSNLAKNLNISPSQLPLYASLSLNYAFDCTDLYRLYERENIKPEKRIFEVAELIKEFSSKEELLQSHHVQLLKRREIPLFRRRLEFYCGSEKDDAPRTGKELWDKILILAKERHITGRLRGPLLEIISGRVKFNSFSFENVQMTPLPETVLLTLRKKIYGILFFECPDTDVFVTEHSFIGMKEEAAPVFVTRKVRFIRRFHPGLLELWSTEESEELKILKKKTFLQAINEKLSVELFSGLQIEEAFVFPVFAAFFLRWELDRGSQIQEDTKNLEVEVILIQAVLANSLTSNEIDQYPNELHLEALNLCAWFIQVISTLRFLNSACGTAFCRKKINLVNYFDGKILQYVYGKLKENVHPEKIFGNDKEMYATYRKLYLTLTALRRICRCQSERI